MTVKDSQRSRCVELIAELGEASGEARRNLSAEEVNLLRGCVELRAKLTFCRVNLAFPGEAVS